MTNDTSTLSGALLEMKDQLIYELAQKGVTAQYDSTTGLLGLINRISDIQTGGGSCYHIELDNSAYTTTGSLTVSATVLKNYSACVGETVTFTGGTSTVTATTNSNGVATATVTFSASGTLTASISNVSDTATVTVQSYLFYDDCSTTPSSSNYGTSKRMTDGQTSTCQLEYDSTNQCYKLVGSGNNISGLPIIALNSKDDVTLRVKFKLSHSTNYCQLILAVTPNLNNNTEFYGVRQMNGTFQYLYDYGNGGGHASDSTSISNITSQWHYLELERSGTSLSCKIYNDSMSSLASFSKTIPSWNDCYYLIGRNTEQTSYYALIDEIKAEPI